MLVYITFGFIIIQFIILTLIGIIIPTLSSSSNEQNINITILSTFQPSLSPTTQACIPQFTSNLLESIAMCKNDYNSPNIPNGNDNGCGTGKICLNDVVWYEDGNGINYLYGGYCVLLSICPDYPCCKPGDIGCQRILEGLYIECTEGQICLSSCCSSLLFPTCFTLTTVTI